MKAIQGLTFAYGLLYLAIGVGGFVPTLTTPTSNPGQGMLLGLFAVNAPHSLLHLAFGAILAWGGLTPGSVISATRLMTVLFGLILVAGFVPLIADPLQLDGTDTLPHLASALTAGTLWWGATRVGSVARGRAA